VVATCTTPEGDILTQTFPFGGGGGVRLGAPPAMTGIPVDSTCTVVEQNTDTFPDGSVVSYVPAGADDPGVTIGGEEGVVVVVTNDFSNVEVQTGSLQVNKVLIPPPPGVDLPGSFVVHVACDDGTDVLVTVPAGGSATVPGITAGAACVVEEQIGSLPPDLEVAYSPSPAIVEIVADETVEVTITNDASNIPPPPPPSPPSPPPPSDSGGTGADGGGAGEGAAPVAERGQQPTGELPFTGAPAVLLGGIGLALIAGGLTLVRRRKNESS
jgi:LPXTG-motif cell wall-anchored protein